MATISCGGLYTCILHFYVTDTAFTLNVTIFLQGSTFTDYGYVRNNRSVYTALTYGFHTLIFVFIVSSTRPYLPERYTLTAPVTSITWY
jgi:hypothetical protein